MSIYMMASEWLWISWANAQLSNWKGAMLPNRQPITKGVSRAAGLLLSSSELPYLYNHTFPSHSPWILQYYFCPVINQLLCKGHGTMCHKATCETSQDCYLSVLLSSTFSLWSCKSRMWVESRDRQVPGSRLRRNRWVTYNTSMSVVCEMTHLWNFSNDLWQLPPWLCNGW